jgi:hypothetical protein
MSLKLVNTEVDVVAIYQEKDFYESRNRFEWKVTLEVWVWCMGSPVRMMVEAVMEQHMKSHSM